MISNRTLAFQHSIAVLNTFKNVANTLSFFVSMLIHGNINTLFIRQLKVGCCYSQDMYNMPIAFIRTIVP